MSETPLPPLLIEQADEIEAQVTESLIGASAAISGSVHAGIVQWLRQHVLPQLGPAQRVAVAVRLNLWSASGRLARAAIVPLDDWEGVTHPGQVVRVIVASTTRAMVEVIQDPAVAPLVLRGRVPSQLTVNPELVGRVCILLDLPSHSPDT